MKARSFSRHLHSPSSLRTKGWAGIHSLSNLFIFNPVSRHLLNNCFFPAHSPQESPKSCKTRTPQMPEDTVIWPTLLSKELLPLELGTESGSVRDHEQTLPPSMAEQGSKGPHSPSASEFCDKKTNPRDQTDPSSC